MKIIKIISSKNNFNITRVKAVANEHYMIVDESEKPFNKLKFVQIDKNLEVYAEIETKEEKIAILENYYDPNMSIFEKLQIWIDKNVDGITTNDELKSLKDLNVKSLNLSSENSTQIDNGNLIGLVSNYTKIDDTKGEMVDVWFATQPSEVKPVVIYNAPVVIEEEKIQTVTF
jgi:hypothetical protein